MLLLYRANGRLPQLCRFIYIPLCFYFIGVHAGYRMHEGKFTFHYASTLSITTPFGEEKVVQIYIPLCFYFIEDGRLIVLPCKVFTFHYASTLSRPPFPLLLSSIRGYFLSTPFLHSSPLKNLPPPALQNMNFP